MKALVGCSQPVHSVLRRWIGSTSFTSRSNRAGQPVLLSSNHGSITTSTIRIALVSTPRSISATRNVGAHRTPTSPRLVLGDTRLRRLSGIGGIASPEERGAAARARLESKSGDGNVDVAPPLEGAPIDLDDLQDLNAEIAGFVGSLGDPDFDFQDNAPTASPASDCRTDGHHHRTDYRGAPGGDHPDTRHDDYHHEQQQEQQQRTTDSDRVEPTDPAAARDKPDPSSHLQQPRRLTLADHPTSPASEGARGTSTEDVSLERQAAQCGSSWLEELRAHSAASSTSSPRAGQGAETPSISALGNASRNHLAGKQVASRRHGESLEGRGGLGASRSVLVLNGAACFVGGRLASTGESQEQVTKMMEEAAAEFNFSLTVCTSNREHELLDRLCAGKYDAVIYNPAGFSAEVVSRAPRRHPGSLNDPADSQLDTRQQSKPEPPRGQGVENGSALEYGLRRARCPIVTLAPRDVHLGRRESRGFGCMEDGISGHPFDHGGGYIEGFSGAVSYRLAIAAVADMLKSERE